MKKLFPLILFVCCVAVSFSQIVNNYAGVTAINLCSNSVTVSNAAGFAAGNRVLVIQMKGVDIDQSNSTAFGTVTNYNNAGNYEFATVASVSGNNIFFANQLLNTYDVAGFVQIVQVPQYTNLTVTTPITAQPWNGTSGGVIAIEASGSVTLNADIDASDLGFRAGIVSLNMGYQCDLMDYYYDITSPHGGRKGEGIFELPNSIINGRGKNANGGGGGNNTNSGGAGGSNGGAGGRGGNQWGGCPNLPIGGDGAQALTYNNTTNKVFLGGGAGGGHQNNAVATSGTNGGGIIIISTPQIIANGGAIKAFSLDAIGSSGDGSGGGGGGGAVLLTATTITGNLTIDVHAGKGGDNTGHGPGGGGGGGVVWSVAPLPGNVTVLNAGGAPGNSSSYPPYHQAGFGQAGITVQGLALPESTTPFIPMPTPVLAVNNPVCQGGTIQFTLTGNYSGSATFSWTGPNSYTSTQRNPQIAGAAAVNVGSYKAVVTDNGCSDSATINVTVNPTYTTTVNPVICAGTIHTLPDGTTVNTAGTYTSTIPAANGCDSVITTNLSVTPLPVVNLGNDTAVCAGATVILNTGNAGATYQWQDASTAQTYTVSTAGTYSVTVTQNSCSASDNITVNYNPLPVVNLGNDTAVCTGQSVVLNADNTGATYQWQDASTAQTLTVSAAGNYAVTVTQTSCTASDAITITNNPIPVVNLGNDTTVCPGESVLLNAGNAGATYLWQDGSTAQTFTATGAGSYSVTVTQSGCSASDNITINDFTPPVINLGNDTAVCTGAVVLLDAGNPGATYVWHDGSTLSTFTVNSAGLYAVTATQNGCKGSDAINVSYNAIPVVNLANDTAVCVGRSVILNAGNNGATYQWQDNSTGQIFTANSAGTYSVSVTQSGCTGSDAISISNLPSPVVDLGNDTLVCNGQTVLLDAGNLGATYQWQDGSTSGTYAVTNAGNYSVQVTQSGCTGSDAVAVSYYDVPVFDLGKDSAACFGETISLQLPSSLGNFLWSTGSVDSFAIAAVDGIYKVSVTNNCGTTTDSVGVSYSNCTCSVLVPTGFSPNGDGANDMFRATATCPLKSFSMVIYNRWGEMVYSSDNIRDPWDGTFKGVKAPISTFVYVVEYTWMDGSKKSVMHGNVTLVR